MFVSLRTSPRLYLLYWHGCCLLVETVFLTNRTVYSTTDKKQEKLLSCIFLKPFSSHGMMSFGMLHSPLLNLMEERIFLLNAFLPLYTNDHLLRTQIFLHVVHFLGLCRLVSDEGSTLRMNYWTRRHDEMTMKVLKTRNSLAAQANQKYTANALVLLSLVLKPFSLKQNLSSFEKNIKILKVLHASYLCITSWGIDCYFKSVGVRLHNDHWGQLVELHLHLVYPGQMLPKSSYYVRVVSLYDETVDNSSVATTVANVPTVSL